MSETLQRTEAKVTIAPRPEGAIEANGKWLWPDTRGAFLPEETIKAVDKIEDETVRKCMAYAEDLSAQIARFKGHTMEDIGDFLAILAQEYGTSRGGQKGNVTLTSYDGLLKVQVQQADLIEFGAQLQTAKTLIDEYLRERTADAHPEIQAIINRAFDVDKAGKIRREELFRLRRLEIEDPRWREAMRAITDAIRIVGSKEYVRFYKRDRPDGAWKAVTIDLARA